VKQLREWLDEKHQLRRVTPKSWRAALLHLVAVEKQPVHLLMAATRYRE